MFRVGDIVYFIDEDDKQPYYAQIIGSTCFLLTKAVCELFTLLNAAPLECRTALRAGLLEDEKVQRSCVVRWLIPSAQAFVCSAVAAPAPADGDVDSAEFANAAPGTQRMELKFALDAFRPGSRFPHIARSGISSSNNDE